MEDLRNDMQRKMPNAEYVVYSMGRLSGNMSHCYIVFSFFPLHFALKLIFCLSYTLCICVKDNFMRFEVVTATLIKIQFVCVNW